MSNQQKDLTPAAGGRWYRQDDGELVRSTPDNPAPATKPAEPAPAKKAPAAKE